MHGSGADVMAACHILGDVTDQVPAEARAAGIGFWGAVAVKPSAPVGEGCRNCLLQDRLVAAEPGDPAVVARPQIGPESAAGVAPQGGLVDN